ncbi:MAG: LysR family transcriptional regulator [Plesiomonas sp.]|uniref:LysR family transcriptional regulator n=1 Tax=Plesiomonas sp. TaxID=2486279 RepID=UPI003F419502
MNLDRLSRLDLNLLVCLHVLLEESSVSRAAQRLHLSQSAVSKALARLREQLDDPLFFRTAHGLTPTYHAEQLAPALGNILHELHLLTRPPQFDPASSERHFNIVMLESAYQTLLPRFINSLLQSAPRLQLHTHLWSALSLQGLAEGQFDLAFTIRELYPSTDQQLNQLPAGLCFETLLTDEHVCLLRAQHPVLQQPWDLTQYLAMQHVQARCEGREWWSLDYLLASRGLQRNMPISVPDFFGAVAICCHTDLIFTVPRCFADHVTAHYPLTTLPLPLQPPTVAYQMLWHERHEQDPAHRWLRTFLSNRLTLPATAVTA